MNYKISIIVPFRFSNKKNTSEEKNFALSSFDKCLSAIFNSKYKNYEVILVSDDSNQSSLEVAKRYPCKIIKLKKNFGAAYARNKGASSAKGQVLLFVDSDVEIQENALQIINEYYNTKNNHGILQGVYSHKPIYKNSITQFMQSYWCYFLFAQTKKNKYTETLCTCFFSIKKDIFLKNKGFDNNFRKADPEDLDLGFKLIKNGHKIPLRRKLICIHHTKFTLVSFIKRTLRIHRSEMKMYLRNKNILMKAKQSNYSTVIFSLILIFLKATLVTGSFFYEIPNFKEIFIILILLFLGANIRFLKFILTSKGLLIAFKSILYIYLHNFLFVICFFTGMVDFYIFKNKY